MNGPFRLCGRTVEVYRYQAEYTEDGVSITRRFPTLEEAETTGGTVTALDAGAWLWMDGIVVEDVPDKYAEAVKIYNMGKEAYEAWTSARALESPEQLRADLDFLAIMQGVEL